MNTDKFWNQITASENYQRWTKEHDAFEQIAIVHSWTQYEDYDVTDMCHNDARLVLCVYCYLQFVLDVEFIQNARNIASDTEYEDYEESDIENAQAFLKAFDA